MGNDRDDDLPIIELSADAPPPRAPHPHHGNRRRTIAIVTAAALVVAAGTTVALTRHDTRRASTPDATIRLPLNTVRAATTTAAAPLLDADAEFIGAMHLVAPGVGWAMNGLALYETTDNAVHWRDITPPGLVDPIGHVNALTFLDADHAWVAPDGSGRGVSMWRTADGGHSWQPIRGFCAPTAKVPSCAATALDFVDAQHGWALVSYDGEEGRLLATNDGGTTWAPVVGTAFTRAVQFVDRRNGWGSTPPGYKAIGTAANPEGAIYRTTDGGHNWRLVEPPSSDNLASPSIAIDAPRFPDDHTILSARLTVARNAPPSITVYVSPDEGASWSAHPAAIPWSPSVDDVVDNRFAAASASDWALAVGSHLYVTHDAGTHWSNLVPTGGTVHEVSISPSNSAWVLADAGPCSKNVASCRGQYLYVTSDGGAAWSLDSPHIGITANRSP